MTDPNVIQALETINESVFAGNLFLMAQIAACSIVLVMVILKD